MKCEAEESSVTGSVKHGRVKIDPASATSLFLGAGTSELGEGQKVKADQSFIAQWSAFRFGFGHKFGAGFDIYTERSGGEYSARYVGRVFNPCKARAVEGILEVTQASGEESRFSAGVRVNDLSRLKLSKDSFLDVVASKKRAGVVSLLSKEISKLKVTVEGYFDIRRNFRTGEWLTPVTGYLYPDLKLISGRGWEALPFVSLNLTSIRATEPSIQFGVYIERSFKNDASSLRLARPLSKLLSVVGRASRANSSKALP